MAATKQPSASSLHASSPTPNQCCLPFAKPRSGKIAVKVINHLGDEVMKVFRVMP